MLFNLCMCVCVCVCDLFLSLMSSPAVAYLVLVVVECSGQTEVLPVGWITVVFFTQSNMEEQNICISLYDSSANSASETVGHS